jgi:hypothetical protein
MPINYAYRELQFLRAEFFHLIGFATSYHRLPEEQQRKFVDFILIVSDVIIVQNEDNNTYCHDALG